MLDDVRTVLDASGSERAVLLGEGTDGGGSCAVFAASFPDRALALIWWHGWSRSSWAPDYPWGLTDDHFAAERDLIERTWGTGKDTEALVRDVWGTSIGGDQVARAWWEKFLIAAASREAALTLSSTWQATDVRQVLPSIQVPSLVLVRYTREEAKYTADRIPGAQLVEAFGDDAPIWLADQDGVFAAIEEFVESVDREQAEFDRVLATVMFTDIVGSSARATDLGDRKWKHVVEQHHSIVRALLGRYRGHEVDTAGDGFFATFDGPARAIRCASAICRAVRAVDLEIRAGVHTGEVETINDKVGGTAVVIGSRISALAGPSEVLVSQTVRDLVAGSGLIFEDAGEHELKGVPDRWHLYRVMG
jgi:class 3 adenylate cyclase